MRSMLLAVQVARVDAAVDGRVLGRQAEASKPIGNITL